VESSLPVAQIDFSQPITSTEEEGNRNKGNKEDFSSDQSAIAVTEGEEICLTAKGYLASIYYLESQLLTGIFTSHLSN